MKPFTGGINISETYVSGSWRARRHHDQQRDKKEGLVVAQFQRLFLDAWALQDCGPWANARYFPPLEPRGSKAMRVVRSDPGTEESEMYRVLLAARTNGTTP